MQPDHFKRQSLALFFIVSVVPALIVGAVWYLYTQTSRVNFLFLDFKSFVLPVIMVGVIPAVVLSFIFAELLARPVRRIHLAALELAKGNFKTQFQSEGAGEFKEIGEALDHVALKLEQTISETRSETALIEAERNKLRQVLNSMTDGVFALDRSGRIILFNKAASEITGRTIESVAGQLAEKVMPFRSGGELVMTRWLASRTGSENKIGKWKGLELYHSDGSSLFVNVQAVALQDDPNGISALVTFHDLTKGHQLEEMKVDFVALAAHELRTPLTEVKGYLDILDHEATGLSRANKAFLKQTITSANQLGSLIHNLLNVSKIEHGEISYQPVELDYAKLVSTTIAELTSSARLQKRTLNLDISPKLPTVHGDPSALREVLVNLIDNALTHTAPSSGPISITVKLVRREIETSVKDAGEGIPAASLPRLFTKFYRVEEMRLKTRGTGLGLYISRSIIEAHSGHIWVESTEGKGSTFTFSLPAVLAPTARAGDNKTTTITRGAHGWIKENSVH